MAVIELKIYKCDICGEESREIGDIIRERIPCHGGVASVASAEADMCYKCRERIRKIIWDNFAEITDDCGKTKIKKKF